MAKYNNKSTRYEDHKGFVYKQALRYFGRAQGAKLSLPFDDIVGELGVAFTQAAKGYKVESGYAFTTFFGMCAQNHMNKVLAKLSLEQYGEERPDEDCVDGDRRNLHGLGLISFEDVFADADASFVGDDVMRPDDAVQASQTLNAIINDETLMPETRAYVTILVNPSLSTPNILARIRAVQSEVKSQLKSRWGVDYASCQL